MDAAKQEDEIHFVRFEDLKEDSTRELRRMVSFLGRDDISESRIRKAAEKCSFRNMKRLEQERGRKYGGVDQFMRKGKSKNWKEMFGENEKKMFEKKREKHLQNMSTKNKIVIEPIK